MNTQGRFIIISIIKGFNNELKKYYIKRSCESLVCLDCFKKYLKQITNGYLHDFLQCHDYYSDCKWSCLGKFSLLINENIK